LDSSTDSQRQSMDRLGKKAPLLERALLHEADELLL
jgi:hypothetical protein